MKKWLVPMLCVLPFLGIALWFIAGRNVGNALFYGLILACPLSHIFLMKYGDHSHEAKKE